MTDQNDRQVKNDHVSEGQLSQFVCDLSHLLIQVLTHYDESNATIRMNRALLVQ